MIPPGHIMKITDAFADQPGFVLTSDQDWASDTCIDTFVSFAQQHSITPTLFMTNESAAAKAAQVNGALELGIHPNFLSNSTHGTTPEVVVDHVLALVPKPVAARCHWFFEHSHILSALLDRGLRIDSNLCLYLQTRIQPLQRALGSLCLPVFWEDDVHWIRGGDWDFARYSELFFTPGLKIINVHSFMFALNAPNATFYAQHKPHIPTLDAHTATKLRHNGQGCATFLADMIAAIQAKGHRFMKLSEAINKYKIEWIKPDQSMQMTAHT